MKFNLKDIEYTDQDPFIKKEMAEKLFVVERKLAIIRFFVILIHIFSYLFLLDKTRSIEWLAYSVNVISVLYSLYVIIFAPYKRFPFFFASYFTSGADAVLITLWLIATGGKDSPFYLLWHISILAVAMRYSSLITLRIAILYSILYLGIFWWDIGFAFHKTEVLMLTVRISHLIFIAILGGWMTEETLGQIEAKILLEKSQEEITKRGYQLQEAHDLLEERIKERTKELDNSNKELLRINEDIDNFAYSTSHDLKSPVLNIEGLLQLLYSKEYPEEEIKVKLHEAISTIKNTINRLALTAKSQKEIYDDIESISFEKLIKDLIIENEQIIKNERVHVEFDFSKADTIIYSYSSLKSILYNLLTNSIKYKMPQRDPVVRFRTERDKEFITLFVKDNGLGIDLKKSGNELFTLFKRFHDHVEGTGMGLYTVKRLMERFGGKIEVESEPGAGTTFKLKFKI